MVSITSIGKYTKFSNFLKSQLLKEQGEITVFDGDKKSQVNISYYINRIMKGIAEGKIYDWCIVVALIYIKRIRENGIAMTEYNIHRLILTSILLAVKYWDDNYEFSEEKYIRLSGVKDEKELTKLQINFLIMIKWKLFIKKIDYDNMELFYMTTF